MPLPVLEIVGTSTRVFRYKNPTGQELLEQVNAAQRTFPEQSNWISRNWESRYNSDGTGFKKVISHLEDVTCVDRTQEQEQQLQTMREFAQDTWH